MIVRIHATHPEFEICEGCGSEDFPAEMRGDGLYIDNYGQWQFWAEAESELYYDEYYRLRNNATEHWEIIED